MDKKGKVWLVGAGPGDAGLLTIKGLKALEEADTVVYDALAGDGIISMIPPSAELIYVGKRAGRHVRKQEEINQILAEEAMKGKKVVRLKGGDPFVFGRGSEEIRLLKAHEIPFEVVPGVTSAVAVPAYCGIPVTHRGLASSFHVITGHGKNGEPVDIDYEALTRFHGTLIFLMGLSSLEAICAGLLSSGMEPDMPAAVLERGTTAGQRKVMASLSEITEKVRGEKINAPAIIVVGRVCSLMQACRWAESRPLHGKKILVTRPRNLASAMSAKLRDAGAEVVEFPAIETRLLKDNDKLLTALRSIGTYQWLVLTSPSGVEQLFKYMKTEKMDVRLFAGIKFAVIGKATEKKLEDYGVYADYMPETYDAFSLGKGLGSQAKGERVLILRAEKGSPQLTKELEKGGISYDDIPLYETLYQTDGPQTQRIKNMMEAGEFDYVTFTSASTVDSIMTVLNPQPDWLLKFTAVCIGRQTRERAEGAGMRTIMSGQALMDSMVETIIGDSSVRGNS